MTSIELMDDLEAGELSVEFEGLEPWDVLEWAIGRFGERLSLSTAFQDGDVALIDMAYRIDPEVRVFSIDTGRLPQETHDLIEELRERYPGCGSSCSRPTAARCSVSSTATGRTCSSARWSSGSLLQRPQGAAAQPGARGRSTPGSPACAATSGPRAPTSARSRSTTTTTRS